jgi:hypothetical protein
VLQYRIRKNNVAIQRRSTRRSCCYLLLELPAASMAATAVTSVQHIRRLLTEEHRAAAFARQTGRETLTAAMSIPFNPATATAHVLTEGPVFHETILLRSIVTAPPCRFRLPYRYSADQMKGLDTKRL